MVFEKPCQVVSHDLRRMNRAIGSLVVGRWHAWGVLYELTGGLVA